MQVSHESNSLTVMYIYNSLRSQLIDS